MRIAFVTGELAFGGTTTFCLFLSRSLMRLGVEVRVFSFRQSHPLRAEFESDHVPVFLENEEQTIFETRLENIYRSLRVFQPNAVFAILGAEAFEVLRHLPTGVLRVGMVHDDNPSVYELLGRYRQSMDAIVAVSEHIKEQCEIRFPRIKNVYLRHGVSLGNQLKRTVSAPGEPIKLLYFGRLEESQKRVRNFPILCAALKNAGVPFCFTIIGSGSEEPFLRDALAKDTAAGIVVMTSALPHPELLNIISKHDVYLLMSDHEAGPLTLIEAMSAGLVPVCSDIPCLVSEVVHAGNGYRIARGDIAGFAQAIGELSRDRILLETISRASQHSITDEFSEAAMGLRYRKFVQGEMSSHTNATWMKTISVGPFAGEKHTWKHSFLGRCFRQVAKRVQK